MSSQNSNGALPLPCQEHSHKIDDIHLAVCGNKELGVPGLVRDVADLKEWRRNIDLRVASIAGAMTVALTLAKHLLGW